MVVIFVVEEHDPIRRFLKEVFDVHQLSIKFLPLIMYVFYGVFQCCCVANFIVSTCFSFMYSILFWLKNLLSKQVCMCNNYRSRLRVNVNSDGEDKYPHDISNLQIYRRLQVLSQVTNIIFGSFFCSVHIACCLGIGILCSFGFIRWHDTIPIASSMIISFAVFVTTFAVLVETAMACKLSSSSEEFLKGV